MVNWTAGTRAIRHSLDMLGVKTVVTARALVDEARLPSGIDLTDVEDTFLFVEDLLASVRPCDKLRAAAARSRVSWASLERVQPPRGRRRPLHERIREPAEGRAAHAPNLLTNIARHPEDGPARGARHRAGLAAAVPFVRPDHHGAALRSPSACAPCSTRTRPSRRCWPGSSRPTGRRCSSARRRSSAASRASRRDRQLATIRLAVTGAEKCPDALFATLRRALAVAASCSRATASPSARRSCRVQPDGRAGARHASACSCRRSKAWSSISS